MSENPRKVFGQNVRHFCKKAELSQEELAELSGMHRTYIGAVERGEKNISLCNIIALAHALKITPSELLTGIS